MALNPESGWTGPPNITISQEALYCLGTPVYTTMDTEAEPFAEPEFIARGVNTGIFNCDVNHRLDVQPSRRSFR